MQQSEGEGWNHTVKEPEKENGKMDGVRRIVSLLLLIIKCLGVTEERCCSKNTVCYYFLVPSNKIK